MSDQTARPSPYLASLLNLAARAPQLPLTIDEQPGDALPYRILTGDDEREIAATVDEADAEWILDVSGELGPLLAYTGKLEARLTAALDLLDDADRQRIEALLDDPPDPAIDRLRELFDEANREQD